MRLHPCDASFDPAGDDLAVAADGSRLRLLPTARALDAWAARLGIGE